MRNIRILTCLIVIFTTSVMAQDKPCLPDSLQYKVYAREVDGKDTSFHYSYIPLNFKKYNCQNCLKAYTISKIRQVFKGEIDYIPQEVRRNREGILSGTDASRRIQKIKSKYPSDSLTNEMALDTIIYKENIKDITRDISRRLQSSRNEFALSIGQIYLVEMIPDLEWALTQDPETYPPLQIKLALARLGVKKYQDYFMDYFKEYVIEYHEGSDVRYAKTLDELNTLYGKKQVLRYINTQGSWDLLLQENLSPNILKICLSGCEYITYNKEFVYHPLLNSKNFEKSDEQKYREMFFAGPTKACYSMESPEKVRETCPKDAGEFLYQLHKKYIKDYVMPYDSEYLW
jgi:hypothetical protein